MKIFRVENSDGRGPYSWNGPGKEFGHDGDPSHPIVPEDEILRRYFPSNCKFGESMLSCGFDSLESLQDWFTDDQIKIMEANGYRVKVLETRKGCRVLVGACQLVFDRCEAFVVETL